MAEGGPKDEQERAKRVRARSLVIAWSLGILAIAFYAATMIRLGPNAMRRDEFAPPAGSTAIPVPATPAGAECKKAGTC